MSINTIASRAIHRDTTVESVIREIAPRVVERRAEPFVARLECFPDQCGAVWKSRVVRGREGERVCDRLSENNVEFE